MNIPASLRRKYSWGPVPQWELDNLEAAKPEPKRRGRPSKQAEGDHGDSTADSDPST
jgi:hypothetical protein